MIKAVRQRLNGQRPDDGFTLVELVVAMIIIAGVLLVLVAVQISAASTIVDARKRTQATAYANEAIEQLRSIPWGYLEDGVYSAFETVGGDDPWVTGTTLTVGGATYTLRTMTPGQEDFDPPRQPLFDTTGRNVQVKRDPAQTNTQFTVRAYVVEPWTGPPDSTLGLVVVVEWIDGRGRTMHTKVESTAYRGDGCGQELDTPYLGACQEHFNAYSQAGTVSTTVTARTIEVSGVPEAPANLLYPSANPYYSLNMRAAVAAASLTSQQVTTVTSSALFGGTSIDDNDTATQPADQGWVNGYTVNTAIATDDVSSPVAAPDVGPTSWSQSEGVRSVSAGAGIVFSARSDYGRPATSRAFTTTANQCMATIPAGNACAHTTFGNLDSIESGSGYILMTVDGQIIRLSRRLAEDTPPSNIDTAWAARFSADSGSAAVGCVDVTGSGCVSAGASRTLADLSIGHVVGGGGWDDDATNGLVTIGAGGTCDTGAIDSVLVQRGPDEKDTPATYTRCGRVTWWSGGAYSQADYSTDAAGPYVTAPVTWSNSNYSITATATVEITAASQSASGADADCVTDECAITAQSGGITVTVEYLIVSATASYVVVSTTVVDGASAFATFKGTPDD